ncbi:MAG: hypothetical protein ACKPJJ_08275 [Planctomycetaceae bacterium]
MNDDGLLLSDQLLQFFIGDFGEVCFVIAEVDGEGGIEAWRRIDCLQQIVSVIGGVREQNFGGAGFELSAGLSESGSS